MVRLIDRRRITHEQRRKDRARAALALGRPLLRSEPVHHHSRSQLVICDSADYHALLHRRERVARLGGDPNLDKICAWCRSPRRVAGFRGYLCEYCSLADALAFAIRRVPTCGIGDDIHCPEPTWAHGDSQVQQ